MTNKNLESKAIDIKGKKYVLVSDRIIYFNEAYPNGSITTELLPNSTDERVMIKATVKPDEKGSRIFTGLSQAVWGDGYINKTSALENCETSAVGRALAMMGIGVIDSIASIDEINKANNASVSPKTATGKQETPTTGKVCPHCLIPAKLNPTKGTYFCPNWKTHPQDTFIKMVDAESIHKPTKSEQEFSNELDQIALDDM